MPLYMDVHRNIGPVTPDDLAQAHLKDTQIQDRYGVCYHKYWLNEHTGTVFCLVEGPDKETCDRVHREAHGLVADALIEVEPALVEVFLGASEVNAAGAVVLPGGKLDRGFRVVLLTEVSNYAEAAHRAGDVVAVQMVQAHDRIARELLQRHHGHEVRSAGESLMACFPSVSSALRFATELRDRCAEDCADVGGYRPRLRIGVAAGEPVEAHEDLFGVSVTAARRICECAAPGEVLVSGAVREVAAGSGFGFSPHGTARIEGITEPLSLFRLQLAQEADVVAVEPPPAKAKQRTEMARAFWNELKRRHVVTVAAVYAGVLFVLLQVAELTFPALKLPEWAFTLLLVLGLFGFPLAVILAWFFDLK